MAGRATRPRLALSIGATLRAANDDWDGNDRTGGTELSDFDSFLDSLFIAASKRGGVERLGRKQIYSSVRSIIKPLPVPLVQ